MVDSIWRPRSLAKADACVPSIGRRSRLALADIQRWAPDVVAPLANSALQNSAAQRRRCRASAASCRAPPGNPPPSSAPSPTAAANSRAGTPASTSAASSPSAADGSGDGLGLPDHERAVHQVERLGRDVVVARSPLISARIGEVEKCQHVGNLIADDRQVDGAVRVSRQGRRRRNGRGRRRSPRRSTRSGCPSAESGRAGRSAARIASRMRLGLEPPRGIRHTSTLSGSASKFFGSNCEES